MRGEEEKPCESFVIGIVLRSEGKSYLLTSLLTPHTSRSLPRHSHFCRQIGSQYDQGAARPFCERHHLIAK